MQMRIGFLALLSLPFAAAKVLYDDISEVMDVGVLDVENKIQIIEFYSPFCGHCQMYKATFAEAAKTLLSEHPDEVIVKAVSCSDQKDLCKGWKINGVPYVVGVPADVVPEPASAIKLDKRKLQWENIVKKMSRAATAERKLPKEVDESRGKASDESHVSFDVPKKGEFDSISGSRKSVPIHSEKDQEQPSDEVGSRVESSEDKSPEIDMPPEPKAGARLARREDHEVDRFKDDFKSKMEQMKKKKKGMLRKPKDPKRPKNVAKDDDEGATDTMKANEVGTEEFLARKRKYVEFMKKQKKKQKKVKFDENKVTDEKLGEIAFHKDVAKSKLGERVPIVKRAVHMTDEEMLIRDATLAFWHGLTFDTYKTPGELSPDKTGALMGWLDLLYVTLPPEWSVQSLIKDLRDSKVGITSSSEKLKKTILKHKMPPKQYSRVCRQRKMSKSVGCGYWRLLHVISVGLAEHRGGLNLVDLGMRPASTKVFSPSRASETIRNYIKHFFYDDDYAESFVEGYDGCDHGRCTRLADDEHEATDDDWKEFALWLWEVHNGVSVAQLNLNADKKKKKRKFFFKKAEAGPGMAPREDIIAALWPTIDDCITCFNLDGSWKYAGVFRFLEERYWPGYDFDFENMDTRIVTFDMETLSSQRLMYVLSAALLLLFIYFWRTVKSSQVQQGLLMARNVGTQLAPKTRKL